YLMPRAGWHHLEYRLSQKKVAHVRNALFLQSYPAPKVPFVAPWSASEDQNFLVKYRNSGSVS
ncbi:hypothetical protein, partial [Enterobacter hormaechei]|uniref:hypothetical protein n=1 Tax=Enterobacter hormaechei TaxID=158836 RepID=UPI00204056F3